MEEGWWGCKAQAIAWVVSKEIMVGMMEESNLGNSTDVKEIFKTLFRES